jgi:hypothetical protein
MVLAAAPLPARCETLESRRVLVHNEILPLPIDNIVCYEFLQCNIVRDRTRFGRR